MNLSDEIRKQIEKNKGLKLDVGEINNHLSTLEGLVRKDIEERKNEVYQKGYDAGIIASSFVDKSDEAYQRGLDDAWKAAKKIVLDTNYGGIALSDLSKIFGGQSYTYIMNKNTAQEAIAKLKVYEEKQKVDDKIEVGDEVETKDGKRFVVTTFGSGFDGDIAVGVCADGLGLGVDLKELHKTGRHFDISKILEEMKK